MAQLKMDFKHVSGKLPLDFLLTSAFIYTVHTKPKECQQDFHSHQDIPFNNLKETAMMAFHMLFLKPFPSP